MIKNENSVFSVKLQQCSFYQFDGSFAKFWTVFVNSDTHEILVNLLFFHGVIQKRKTVIV